MLCSGALGFAVLKEIHVKWDVVFVFTDFNSKAIIEYSTKNNIPLFKGNPRDSKSEEFSKNNSSDVLISINYLFVVESNVIKMAKGIAFNVHGSLLPKYRGRTPHVWAIINNEHKAGITAHLLEESCDTGDILRQLVVPISEEDTGNSILMKYHELYQPLIEEVLLDFAEGKLKSYAQNEENATYFGKRSPEDGLISWDWHKERIRNWVRAQSYPYPGAFSFYAGKKIIIDSVEFSNSGYRQNMKNGEIIKINPLEVKSPNGIVVVRKIRNSDIRFKKGDCLR